MNGKEKIAAAIIELQSGEHFFPPDDFKGLPSESQPKPRDQKGIKIAMGMKAQGIDEYVSRLVEAGCGWHQVGRAVGWAGFALFAPYYNEKYSEQLNEKGLRIRSVNQGLVEGWYYYDEENKTVFKAETTDDVPYNSLRNAIVSINLGVEDKDAFDQMDWKLDMSFNKDMDVISDALQFHTVMKKDENAIELKALKLEDLMATVLDLQSEGYKRTTPVFYDLIDVEVSKKRIISKKALAFYQNVGFE